MIGKYAYSLNGEDYLGAFDTRVAAELAGFDAARRESTPPDTIFVGRMVAADPKATGHAWSILARMTGRARQDYGDTGGRYLSNLTNDQVRELDSLIEIAILGWLQKHERMPRCFRVESVAECLVPRLPGQTMAKSQDEVEVHDLGVTDSGLADYMGVMDGAGVGS
jgi:hypothetical protein